MQVHLYWPANLRPKRPASSYSFMLSCNFIFVNLTYNIHLYDSLCYNIPRSSTTYISLSWSFFI
nr:MAG TPA: hypothetical protein [Caudoviricetes sp.]